MAKKIEIKDDSDTGEDPTIVAKVDEMMDPDQESAPNEEVAAVETEAVPELKQPDDLPKISREPELPPLDIFADAPSAPPLIKKHSKKQLAEPAVAETPPVAETVEEEKTEETKEMPQDEASITEVESEEPVAADEVQPEEFDDPKTAEAIDDIVAHEGDTVLSAEDSKRQQKEADSQPVKKEKHGHPIFWTLVFIVCIVAIGIAAYLIDPQLFHPLSRINWSSIRRHL